MRVRVIEFEGTPEEYKQSGLQRTIASHEDVEATGSSHVVVEDIDPIASLREDEAFLRRVLDLRPLTPSLDKLFRRLLDAAPQQFVSRSEIGTALACTQNQIDGVLGSLGRRVNETPRHDMNTALHIGVLLEWTRANGASEWCYRFWPTFRSVLEGFYGNR